MIGYRPLSWKDQPYSTSSHRKNRNVVYQVAIGLNKLSKKAPGDFVSLIFAINNKGTSAVNLGAMSFSGVGSLWVPATFSSATGVVATTSGEAGFAYGGLSQYAIYPGNAYTTSSTYEPSGILAPGGTAVFWFYVGLTSNAGNNYVGQNSGTLTLTASVTSAA